MNIIMKFIHDEDGATAIEYGLLASLIGVAIVVGAKSVGTEVNELFGSTEVELKKVVID